MVGRKTGRSATRKDVARLAGVSPTAVSLALNNNPGIRLAEVTREKIKAVAKELNYRPSHIAKALSNGRTMTIGVILNHWAEPFSDYIANLMNGFWSVIKKDKYRVTLAPGEETQSLAGLYTEKAVDGIIVLIPYMYGHDKDIELQSALESKYPVIFVAAKPIGLNVEHIGIDDYKAGYEATIALIKAGHKKILHLAGPYEHMSSAADRYQGYKDALKNSGIPFNEDLVGNGFFSNPKSYQLTKEKFEQGIEFSAVFAANGHSFHGAGLACVELGLKIPEDISFTSIDNDNYELYPGLDVFRIESSVFGLGAEAAKRLVAGMNGEEVKHSEIPFTIHPGNSIAKV